MKLLGILYLNEKQTYIGKNGEKLKKFRSYYDCSEYLVKTKRTNMNQTYCIIDTIDNNVIEYLDNFNIYDIPKKMSIINWVSRYHNLYKNDDYLNQIRSIDLTPKRVIIKYDNIISIDPLNCVDIDDAINILINDKQVIINIHIADPTSYIDEYSDFDKELLNRTSSIYLDNVYHMLPEQLVNIISLNQLQERRAFTCKITFNDIDNIVQDIKTNNFKYEFIKTTISVSCNLNYDQFELEKDNNDYYKKIYDIGKLIYIGLNIDNNYDAHKMVEAYMILCNMCASFICPLKRSNDIVSGNNKYSIYNQSCAEYTLEDKKHQGLNISYTHFTSPLRRYADMIVHRLIDNNRLNNKLIDNNRLNNNINIINNTSKYYKKVYTINNILNLLNNNTFIETSGIFVGYDNCIKLLIDNKLIYVNIANYKLLEKEIIEILYDNDIITIKYKNNTILYKIGDKINIKIFLLNDDIKLFRIVLDDLLIF